MTKMYFDRNRKKIIIVGGGFGGIYVADGLKMLAKRGLADITLISRNNYFLFTPLLHEVATGGLSLFSAAEPIREILRKTKIKFYQAEVQSIDTNKRIVSTNGENLLYDILVLAPGATTNFYDVSGAEKYGLPLKTLSDAVKIRTRVINTFEKAALTDIQELRRELLTFVIVGAGPTGVELAAEMAEFIFSTIYPYYEDTFCKWWDMKVILISSSGEVLSIFPQNIQYWSRGVLIKKGVEVKRNARVVEVSDEEVVLSSGEKIKTRTVLWTAGVKAEIPEIKGEIKMHKSGRILTDPYLRASGFHDFFILGDSAAFPEKESEKLVPMFAQVAVGQAEIVVENIKSLVKGNPLKPWIYRSKGFLVSLGQWRAVGMVMGFKLQGRFAWWLWRTVYLFKFISWKKKFRIAFEWTINLFYPRDITKLD
jgi:NADH:ubiquinone reductase (H+-translocating)